MFGRPKIKTIKKCIGNNVKFGKNIKITGFKDQPLEYLYIGDDCVFHDNVHICVAPSCHIGDGNVFHNGVRLVGSDVMNIKDYNWIGEKTFLDSTGKLSIGSRNVIGLNCMVWSHLIRPQSTLVNLQPTLGIAQAKVMNMKAHTMIGDQCWLIGGNIQVSPGVHIQHGSIILANSVVTKRTTSTPVLPGTSTFGNAYGGVPAKPVKVDKWQKLWPIW